MTANHTTNTRRSFSLRDMALCSLFAAILAVSAWLTIPGEVPFTLQTFGVFAALGLLGGKRGTIARGGFGVLLGTTGGYIFGFLLSGLLYWALTSALGQRAWTRLLAMVAGLLLCYAAGTAWFMLVYLRQTGPIALSAVLLKCVVPFLLPDAVKLGIAWILSQRLARFVP